MTTRALQAAAALACLLALLPPPAQARKITVAYGPDGQAQSLDLYRPDGAAPAKLVVFVHGGGWTKGNKAGGWHIAKPLAEAGYAVASINYRMLDQATLPDEAADVATATAFLLAHARDYGIDPTRYALAGHSAGGHLVALVGTDPSYARAAGLDLSRLAAVITLDGVFDIRRARARNPVITTDRTFRWQMSPTAHAGEVTGHPLFCLIHEDLAARFGDDAHEFATALKSHGVTVTEAVAPGLNHGALVGQFDNPAAPMEGEVAACLKQVM
jgi:arylformamidase